MLNQLKEGLADREKINLWLDHIQESDPVCRNEVIEHCAKDKEARAYYVKRYIEDCIKI